MKYINELSEILSQQLNWHKSRIECLAQMLLALFVVRSVNLSEIAVAMEGRVRRVLIHVIKEYIVFFSKFEIDFTWIARWIYSLFFNQSHKVYLAMDRTNWYWGKAKINVFMLSICYEGIAIPIFWRLLIAWLAAENIPFYLRIKGNVGVCIGRKKFKTSSQLFTHLAPYQQQVFGMNVHWSASLFSGQQKFS